MKPLVFAIALAILASFAIAPSVAADADAPDVAFECVITADRTTYVVGEVPKITVRIHNKTANDVVLVGALDGSCGGTRFPQCRIAIVGTARQPTFTSNTRCSSMNRLKTKDFVTVAGGESFDPCGKGFFRPFEFIRFPVSEPGTYTVRFYYTTSDQVSDYYGDERRDDAPSVAPELRQLIQRVPKLDLTSNELTLTFTAKAEEAAKAE